MARTRAAVTGGRGVSAGAALRRRRKSTAMAEPGTILTSSLESPVTDRLRGHALPRPFREGEYIHVSDLLHKCMRMVALSYRTNTRIAGEAIRDGQSIIHAIGHGIQGFVTQKLGIVAPTELYGRWTCLCGATDHVGLKEEAWGSGACTECQSPPANYGELILVDKERMIVGSVDLALLIEAALYLIEVKSIKKENWEALTRPQPEHILQIVFYWYLARAAGTPLHRQVSVVYVSKDFAFKGSPYKEFCIDPMDHIHRLDDYLTEAEDLLEARRGGSLPVRTCPERTSPLAKKCELCSVCFSMQE